MALVITLALLVLVTFAVVAFFSLATSNLGAESARARNHQTADAARGAEDWLAGRLLQALSANTTSDTVQGVAILDAPPAYPVREVASALASDADFAGLVWQSLSFNGTTATHSSADPARNGRRIEPARWDAPRLVSGNKSFTASTAPSWLYLRADGTVQAAPHADAIARFAFHVYEVGGLLDANVAGFPASLSSADRAALRGTQAAADLTALGVSPAAVDSLMAFRHTNLSDYPGLVTDASTRGFLEAGAGNRHFATRQDLIRFATRDVPALAPALPFLTHFSREVAAPSWSPETPSGSSVAYAAEANDPAKANRFLPRVRAPGNLTLTRYRDDGSSYPTQIRSGAPLVNTRFSLAKMAWIGAGGPVTANAAAIESCFGLAWDNAAKRWNYTAGTGGGTPAIKTLAQVAAENRDPNFFELLKAGILTGSTGKDGGGGTGGGGSLVFDSLIEADSDLQILQIGANLIDQWDADSIPTAIGIDRAGAAWEAVGIESLPGLAQFKAVAGKSPDNPANRVAIYFLANLWNPHQAPPSGQTPALRLTVRGSVRVVTRNVAGTTQDFAIPASSVSVSPSFFLPGILTSAGLGNGTAAGMEWVSAPAALGNYAGFRLPDYLPAAGANGTLYGGSSGNNVIVRYTPDTNNPFQMMLEYEAAPGVWRGYSFLTGNNDPDTWIRNNYQQWIAGGYPATMPLRPPDFSPALLNDRPLFARTDPRVRRFTPVQFDHPPAGMFAGSLWSDTSSSTGFGDPANGSVQLKPPGIFGSSAYPALLARNNNSDSQYTDNDSIRRIADSGLFTGSGADGNPYANTADRPVVLNRPFRSVAEMGMACRDLPFRSLDFFTALSADGGLIDLLCLTESEAPLRAGAVSLNSPHARVFEALLRDLPTNPDGSGALSDSDAAALASALVARTASTKATNPAAMAGLSETVHPTGANENRKPSRETLARALAGISQTRTWNLLADIIVQTGQFPAIGGTNADQWIIEGESRTWTTLAIDRFLARVVDRQSEKPTE